MKKYLKIILLNLFSVILLLVVAELLVRILYPEINLSGTSSKLIKENVYYNSPGLTSNIQGISYGSLKETDSYGFWKYKNTSDDSTNINWLLLGDSATMGIGVDNDSTFAGILQSKLDSVRILNPALIGYSSIDYLHILQKLIDQNKNRLKIKRVLIFWCLNDVYSLYPTKASPDIRSSGLIGKLVQLLSMYSKTWHLLKEIFTDRQKDYFDYDSRFYSESDTNFVNSMENIKQCVSIAAEYGISTKLFLLPYEYQIRYISQNKFQNPQNLIIHNLQNYKIQVIDILKLIGNKKIDSKSLYLFGDGIHFSKKGHKLIAQLLIENKFN